MSIPEVDYLSIRFWG